MFSPLIFSCLFNSLTVSVTNCSSLIPQGIIAGEMDLVDWFDFIPPPPPVIHSENVFMCLCAYVFDVRCVYVTVFMSHLP